LAILYPNGVGEDKGKLAETLESISSRIGERKVRVGGGLPGTNPPLTATMAVHGGGDGARAWGANGHGNGKDATGEVLVNI